MESIFKLVNQVSTLEVVKQFLPNLAIHPDGSDRHKALCPFHQENTPSFKIFTNRWKCFGCDEGGTNIDLLLKTEIARTPLEAAIQLATKFGIPVDDAKTCNKGVLRIAEYAAYVNLPEDFLRETFLLEDSTKGVKLLYLNEGRETVSIQLRHRLKKGAKGEGIFSWMTGKPYLYGAWFIPEWRGQGVNPLILCEGASDVQVCRFMGVAALGVPGATTFKNDWTKLLVEFPELVIIEEPDTAGEGFVKKIIAALKTAKYQGLNQSRLDTREISCPLFLLLEICHC